MNINKRSAELQQKMANENRKNYQRPEASFDEKFTQPPSVTMEKTNSNPIDDELRRRGLLKD